MAMERFASPVCYMGILENALMEEPFDLRERQAPLKAKYKEDPDSGKTTISVRSVTTGDHPMRSRRSSPMPILMDLEQHRPPLCRRIGDDPCSGDLLMAALAACQEVTLRMVASAMGIQLDEVDITVEGDMDFQGTMGTNPDTPVGFTNIRTKVNITADALPDCLERLAQRAEKYCVVNATLRERRR